MPGGGPIGFGPPGAGIFHPASEAVDQTNTTAYDTFSQVNASNLGVADVGGKYDYNGPTIWSTNGSFAQITYSGSAYPQAYLWGVTVHDGQSSIIFSFDKLPTPVDNTTWLSPFLLMRVTPGAANSYGVGCRINGTPNAIQIAVYTPAGIVAGYFAVTRETLAAGVFYNLAMTVSGSNPTTITGSVWRVGTPKPTTPDISTTDSVGPQGAGGVGFNCGSDGATNYPIVASFDNYRVGLPFGQTYQSPLTANLHFGPDYVATVKADSPISLWMHDEPSGTTVVDSVGANTGAYHGSPTLGVTGPILGHTAMTLNGSTQYAQIPDNATLDLGDGPMTYETWVKWSGVAANQYLFAKGTQHPTMFINPAGQVSFQAYAWDAEVSSGAVALDTTNWHHIVGTKGTGATWKLYIDKVDVTTIVSTANPTTISTATDLFIGSTSVPDLYFTGSQAATAVYGSVLSATRIAAHYDAAQSSSNSLVRRAARAIAGTLSFGGGAAGFQPDAFQSDAFQMGGPGGVLIKRVARTLAGALSFSGLLNAVKSGGTAFTQGLTAALTFSGSLTKRPAKSLTASLSFAGAIAKRTNRSLTGALSFVGAFTKRPGKALTAALSFVGADAFRTAKALSATLTFSGALAKRLARTLTGGLSFSGLVNTVKSSGSTAYTQTLTAALSFSGAISKRTSRTIGASVSFVGALTKSATRTLTAALTFTGAIAKRTSRTLTATVSFIGTFAKQTGRALAGGLSFVGTLFPSRLALRILTASLSFVGATTRRTGKSLTGGLTFVGSIVRSTTRTLSASLTFTGSLVKRTARTIAASLSFSGLFNAIKNGGAVAYTQTFTAALTFSGALVKRTSRTLTAGLTFAGALAKTGSRTLAATLAFTGALAKRTSRSLAGALSFSGAIAKRTGKTFTATLSFVGFLAKPVGKALTASLAFSGSLGRRIAKTLTGNLSFSTLLGSLKTGGSVAYTQSLQAALAFSGAITKRTSRLQASALSFSGALANSTRRTLTGAVSFVGSLTRSHVFNRTLTATLSFVGAIRRQIGKGLAGVLTFSGAITRAFRFTYSSTLTFAGAVAKGVRRTFTATLSFVGFITSGAGFITGGFPPLLSSAASQIARAVANAFRPGGDSNGPTPGGDASNPTPKR